MCSITVVSLFVDSTLEVNTRSFKAYMNRMHQTLCELWEKSPSVTQRGARKSFWWFVSGCFRAELHAEYLFTEYLKLIRIYDHQSLWQLTLSQTTSTHEHFNHGGKKQKRCLTTSDKALKFCSSKQRIYSVHQSIHSLPLPVTSFTSLVHMFIQPFLQQCELLALHRLLLCH